MSLDVLTPSVNSMGEGVEASIFYCAAQQPVDESNRLRNALLQRRRGATLFEGTTQSEKLYVLQSTNISRG